MESEIKFEDCCDATAAAEVLLRKYTVKGEQSNKVMTFGLVRKDMRRDIIKLAEHFYARGKGEWDYDTLVKELHAAPLTYLPALLVRIVQVCMRKPVFRSGGLLRMVQHTMAQVEANGGSEVAATIKPGDTVECTCGNGHTWRTKAVEYGESWQPRTNRCAVCVGVYLTARMCGVARES